MFTENRLCGLYRRASGHVRKVRVVGDGSVTAIARGNMLMKDADNNAVIAWTTTSKQAGIALEPSTAATTVIEMDLLVPGEAVIGDVDTGTPAANDFRMINGDVDNVQVGTSTNDDFLCLYIGSATEVLLYPNDPMVGTNGA